MPEETTSKPTTKGSTTESSSSSSKGGRGSRHRARGGGRGRGSSKETSSDAKNASEQQAKPKHGGGGRGGGRNHHRGRGRGGRGRGRGRFHKHEDKKDVKDEDSAAPPTKAAEAAPPNETLELKTEKEETPSVPREKVNSNQGKAQDSSQEVDVEDATTPDNFLGEEEAAPVLKLPSPPKGKKKTKGVMILSRHSHPPATKAEESAAQTKSAVTPRQEAEVDPTSEATDRDALKTEEEASAAKSKKKKKKKKKQTVEASLSSLKAQEVSITAATQVKVKQEAGQEPEGPKPGDFSQAPVATTKKKKSKKKKKAPSQDAKANQKLVKQFNHQVKSCVDQSDPGRLYDLLHDKSNHHFALTAPTLEAVLKAYVMAAMFSEALYCLRNNVQPGTLDCLQLERIMLCLPQNLRNSSAFSCGDMIDALVVATNLDASRTWLLRIVRGIALEFLEEATSARDRFCSTHCERLVKSGLCVVNAKLERGKKATELLVVPGDQLGVILQEGRGIQAGDAVSIMHYASPYPTSAESLDRDMMEAIVVNTNPMVLRLQDKTASTLLRLLEPGNIYRIDKLANRMGYNRQLAAAVSMVLKNQTSRELVQAITAMDENIQKMGRGETTSTAALCAQRVSEEDTAEEQKDYGLNMSQQLAVKSATTNRLTLVQGPPGTGKTAVAICILQEWARRSPKPILATSDSNIAVDNLVQGAAAAGLRVVRLGRPEAIRPELLRYCIDRPQHKERLKQLRQAQVICCTCIGAGGDLLESMTLDRVLVDEATQATEAAVLVPLTRGCQQLVLVGDHCQLPPTVLSTQAQEEGHGVPLFSRMVACGVVPHMLDTQFRMHPAIAMFPSDLFYGGLLKNGVSAPERRPLAGFPWPREEFPVAFLPIYGEEIDDGGSKYNAEEADAACNAVTMLLEGGQCSMSDIAVCTPYAAQARLIRRMLRRNDIEVSSVDGFQGREKQAVVFSAVRSNDYGALGFALDWRRVNVSFTRARRALVVIGNDRTLRCDADTWMPWLAWADAHGINMDKPGVSRGRYDPEPLRRVRGGTTAAEMLKDVLERQQAQLEEDAQRQELTNKELIVIQEELLAPNAEGNWDDSENEDEDDKNAVLIHSPSKQTLTSMSSDVRSGGDDEDVVDVWDL